MNYDESVRIKLHTNAYISIPLRATSINPISV
jgi:hypothetical protein